MEDTNKQKQPTNSFLNDLIYVEDNVLPVETCVNLVNYMDSIIMDNSRNLNRSVIKSYKRRVKIDEIHGGYGYELNNIIKRILKKYFNLNQIVSNYFKLYDDVIISDYSEFLMLKYEQNTGIFEYHDDSSIENDKFRILTFLWYLNDVDIGGETEFFDEIKIKPKQGRLLVFPCAWPYIHRGNIPITTDKYIITGWVYAKNIFK
jgi:hypothetical protein